MKNFNISANHARSDGSQMNVRTNIAHMPATRHHCDVSCLGLDADNDRILATIHSNNIIFYYFKYIL